MIISICLFSIGYFLLGFYKVRDRLERLGIGYLLVFGVVGIILFGLSVIGIKYSSIFSFSIILLGLLTFIYNSKDFSI